MGVPGISATVPPPLPPRRPVSSYQNSYSPYNSFMGGGYGSSWNNMGMSRYGFGASPYSAGYSMYGNQWGGPSGDVENRYLKISALQ